MEYQRIRCLSRFAACQYGAPFWGCLERVRRGPRGVSFGTLLGPEATGPYLAAMRVGAKLVPLVPAFSYGPHGCAGAGGGDGVVV